MSYALLEGWGGGKGDEVDLYETIMKSCVIRFSNYWLQILIFSSTRGCSLEREMLTVNYLCK